MFRTGTSCSGIPDYIELLMRLASFSPTKRTSRCRKRKRSPTLHLVHSRNLVVKAGINTSPKEKNVDPGTLRVDRGSTLFYFRSTPLNANGKYAAIQWHSRSRNWRKKVSFDWNILFRYFSLHGIANEVGILFSNKKNQQMSKKKEKSLITPVPFQKLGR
ncbi:hypothetical protein CDAR_86291 [Caerostris darwini]|uniref:Uncharacterized protein n=1 Tax=Caerostris darwini TaxID=1538125 RepID=A0AAV4NPD9_9ARAC|nr:hypothetical protein CDAR_86291 [Caerostris darwini]